MIYVLFLLATFALIYSANRGFLDLFFLVMFHLYIGIFLRSIYLSLGDNEQYTVGENFIVNDISNVYYLILCFFLFFFSFIYFSKNKASNYVSANDFSLFYDTKKFNLLISFYFIAYALHFLTLFLYIGGIGDVFTAFSQRAVGAYEYPAYFTLIQDFYVVLTVFLFFIRSMSKNGKVGYLIIIMLLMTIFSLVLSGGRGNLMQFILSLLCIGMLRTKNNVFVTFRLASFALVAVLVLVAGLSNRIVQQSPDIAFFDALTEVNESIVEKITGTMAIYDHFQLAKIYTDETGYDYGKLYLYNFLKPIPRDVWVDKPLSLDLTIRDYFWGDTLGGIPPGLFGEFYIVGGSLFMLVGTIGFAMLTSRFSNALPKIKRDSVLFYIYVLIMPYWFFSLIRLGVDIFFTRTLIALFFSYVIYVIYTRRLKVK